jgi:hypothetical protein
MEIWLVDTTVSDDSTECECAAGEAEHARHENVRAIDRNFAVNNRNLNHHPSGKWRDRLRGKIYSSRTDLNEGCFSLCNTFQVSMKLTYININ